MNYVSQNHTGDLFDIIYVYAHFRWFNFKLNVGIAECISMPRVRNYHRHSWGQVIESF